MSSPVEQLFKILTQDLSNETWPAVFVEGPLSPSGQQMSHQGKVPNCKQVLKGPQVI